MRVRPYEFLILCRRLLLFDQFNSESIFDGWNIFHPYAILDFTGVL